MKYNKEILEDLKKLGHNIRKYREQKNTSINELSMLTGIRTNYLRKIENGTAYGVLLNTHIVKIANALGITLYEIFSINKKLNLYFIFICHHKLMYCPAHRSLLGSSNLSVLFFSSKLVRFRNKFGMTVFF